ncbi:MAG TPA: isoprenylcysteine carboxylmethyltransferase family protein [Candidatus Saccharimonadaceae bacterium]|nr:isoprenylcysteine carboxylmethyltransferase family protein [Candidatus Saccharimonadaceae bacterium]
MTPPVRPRVLPTLISALVVTAVDAALLALALGGVAPLAHHARALALIAVWAASALTLGFLRPVRAQDVVERASGQRLLLVLLFFVPLLTPPLSALGERFGWWPLPGGAALCWAGVALAALGLALRIAAMAQLGSRFAPIVAVQREHALETRGLYARMRHPGYVGAGLANLGAALAFGSAVGLAGALLMALALDARIRQEEALLASRFGDEFARYRAHSGRIWPRLGRGGA